MDFSKKRKAEENGDITATTTTLSPGDVRKLLQPFTTDQLLDVLQSAVVQHLDVLDDVRSIADRDSTLRKLFIRGLGAETTSESLSNVFASYGELDEGIVIFDKNTGKSKGYGFVTFKHADCALLAHKEPSKKIDDMLQGSQYGAQPPPGGLYSGYPGGGYHGQGPPPLPAGTYGVNSSFQQSAGGAGLHSMTNQVPPSGPGYGANYGGAYSGQGTAEFVSRLPPSSLGMPSGAYPDGGNYGLTSSVRPSQHSQPPPMPRVPPGGMYQGMPPYY